MTVFEMSPGLAAYLLSLTFLFGACMGSFLHCAGWRYARKESVLKGRSRCPACRHVLGIPDLIPVFSWLFLRGKCRHCGARVPVRYLLGEVVCGILFLSAVFRFGLSWRTFEYLIFVAVLFYLSLTDLETMELPDLPMLLAAVSWLCFLPTYDAPLKRLKVGLIGALTISGAVLALALVMDQILGRESLGGGDVKLLALTGLYLGWDGNLLALMLACLLGLALAAALGRRREAFPFGPAIALAGWLTVLFGDRILDWYWGLF